MTLRQTIQAAPGKTAELIKKLSGTSNQAVKTRENLFAQLSEELTRYVELEQEHFLPILRKHSGTKDLAVDALKGNKELLASVNKLSEMPKDNDEFLSALDSLNGNFQQYVRNERKELLPAVLKAFSDEEASALAENIGDAVAEAEKSRRDEKREEAAEAKRQAEEATRQAEEAEQAKAAERSAARAKKVAERIASEASEKALEVISDGAASVQSGARQITASLTERVQDLAEDSKDALAIYGETSEKIRDDVKAMTASSAVSVSAVTEIYSVWSEWFNTAARVNAESVQKLMQAKSLQQVAELQQEFATSALRNWMDRNAKIVGIAQEKSKQAQSPLSGLLKQVA